MTVAALPVVQTTLKWFSAFLSVTIGASIVANIYMTRQFVWGFKLLLAWSSLPLFAATGGRFTADSSELFLLQYQVLGSFCYVVLPAERFWYFLHPDSELPSKMVFKGVSTSTYILISFLSLYLKQRPFFQLYFTFFSTLLYILVNAFKPLQAFSFTFFLGLTGQALFMLVVNIFILYNLVRHHREDAQLLRAEGIAQALLPVDESKHSDWVLAVCVNRHRGIASAAEDSKLLFQCSVSVQGRGSLDTSRPVNRQKAVAQQNEELLFLVPCLLDSQMSLGAGNPVVRIQWRVWSHEPGPITPMPMPVKRRGSRFANGLLPVDADLEDLDLEPACSSSQGAELTAGGLEEASAGRRGSQGSDGDDADVRPRARGRSKALEEVDLEALAGTGCGSGDLAPEGPAEERPRARGRSKALEETDLEALAGARRLSASQPGDSYPEAPDEAAGRGADHDFASKEIPRGRARSQALDEESLGELAEMPQRSRARSGALDEDSFEALSPPPRRRSEALDEDSLSMQAAPAGRRRSEALDEEGLSGERSPTSPIRSRSAAMHLADLNLEFSRRRFDSRASVASDASAVSSPSRKASFQAGSSSLAGTSAECLFSVIGAGPTGATGSHEASSTPRTQAHSAQGAGGRSIRSSQWGGAGSGILEFPLVEVEDHGVHEVTYAPRQGSVRAPIARPGSADDAGGAAAWVEFSVMAISLSPGANGASTVLSKRLKKVRRPRLLAFAKCNDTKEYEPERVSVDWQCPKTPSAAAGGVGGTDPESSDEEAQDLVECYLSTFLAPTPEPPPSLEQLAAQQRPNGTA